MKPEDEPVSSFRIAPDFTFEPILSSINVTIISSRITIVIILANVTDCCCCRVNVYEW